MEHLNHTDGVDGVPPPSQAVLPPAAPIDDRAAVAVESTSTTGEDMDVEDSSPSYLEGIHTTHHPLMTAVASIPQRSAIFTAEASTNDSVPSAVSTEGFHQSNGTNHNIHRVGETDHFQTGGRISSVPSPSFTTATTTAADLAETTPLPSDIPLSANHTESTMVNTGSSSALTAPSSQVDGTADRAVPPMSNHVRDVDGSDAAATVLAEPPSQELHPPPPPSSHMVHTMATTPNADPIRPVGVPAEGSATTTTNVPPPHTSLSEPHLGMDAPSNHRVELDGTMIDGLAMNPAKAIVPLNNNGQGQLLSSPMEIDSTAPQQSMERPILMSAGDNTSNGMNNMTRTNLPNANIHQSLSNGRESNDVRTLNAGLLTQPTQNAPHQSNVTGVERIVPANQQELHRPMSYSEMEQRRTQQQQQQQQQQPPNSMGMNNSPSFLGMGQQQQLQQQRNNQMLSGGGGADRSPQSVVNHVQHNPNGGGGNTSSTTNNNNSMMMMQREEMNQMHALSQQQSLPPHLRNHPNMLYENNINTDHRPPTQIPQFAAGLPPPGNMFGNVSAGDGSQQQQQHIETPPQNAPQGGGGLRELRVEDALFYLDDVKREFKDRPAIYNEFLSIMKNFKSQEVDTPGVIDRVSKLFRGYNNLILGFNTFLPDGCKISLADLERADAQRIAEEQAAQLQAQIYAKVKKPKGQGSKRGPKSGQATTGAAKHPPPGGGMRYAAQNPPGFLQNGTPGQQDAMATSMPPGNHPWGGPSPDGTSPPSIQDSPGQQPQPPRTGPFGNQPMQTSPPPQQHQAVEFDHAISYVTTIKKRFASDPNTYHSFLEILHTYQKEQRGIKEVLEQVARLFQDHSDLLKEFAFFLPDAVQEQAKERLHRAVAESESRIAAQRQQQIDRFTPRPPDNRAAEAPVTVSSDSKTNRGTAVERQRAALQQPESFVYNSAVERQFFDSTRESLTTYSRDSGQAWAEFMKCLDMYAQEILSRTEMLNFVEPLLGKRNSNLFEEFKRILSAAGSPTLSTQLMDDAWYSVPLAEIDFGRCRRCSPSYRALPRDYPAPPCSERSEVESKVLNDVWLSLPVGSEESYTFRHMRRNTYEETLFRVEDERFEIDMVIDSNAATLQRLDPIAKEIALLAQEDIVPMDIGVKSQVDGAGLGGKRYQYTFDKKILGVVHRNTIARIYGDNGQEMLDLLVRNPTVAVPLVVQRLQQKDTEWRIVRERLNKHWKDLAEHNYYKSLDHRSLTWRTTDKRAIGARSLVTEIKDRAANGGRESKEAYRQKLDKAKEEHGTFFEVTVGTKLTCELDLTFLPKPDRRLFTPHLTLNYKNVSWAQRDAYRILAFALERGTITPADKERCHRLWVEFLGPWFALSFNWMQKPAVTYQESTAAAAASMTRGPMVGNPTATVVSEDDEESLDEEPELVTHMVTEELPTTTTDVNMSKEYTDHHPLPAGAQVSTLYGEGKIIEFRRTDHVYAVRLGFGAIGYLRPATVLCSMLPVEKSAYTRQLRAEDRTKLARPNDQLAFGTQSLYLFFRLHEILVQRLNTAKRLAYSVGDDRTLQSMVEQMPNINPKVVGRRRYEAYLSLIYALLDGGVGGAAEGGKYEDRVRSLLGHQAYELATMDKLIAHIWKDIQTMANDETMWSLIQLYRRHVLAGSFQPEAFRQEAAYLSDGEAMYAFQHCYLSPTDESVLHVEYLGIMDDGEDMDPIDTNMEDDLAGTNSSSMELQQQQQQAHPPPPPILEPPASKRPKR